MALGEKQRTKYGVRWILEASQKKMGKTVEERLAREMVSVVRGDSEALRKKEEIHKFAMVNRCVTLNLDFKPPHTHESILFRGNISSRM